MKGIETRLVIYLNPVSPVSGGKMEENRPGLFSRAASRVTGSRAGAMFRRWKVGMALVAALTIIGFTIGAIILAVKANPTDIVEENIISSTTTNTSPTTAPSTTASPSQPSNNKTVKYLPYNTTRKEPESMTVAFYSLLAMFLNPLMLAALDLWLSGLLPALQRAWHSLTRGRAEDPRLLHTQPYYLAITRSTCQVGQSGPRRW